MRVLLVCFLLSIVTFLGAQSKALLLNLPVGDSLVVYQCHVETATVSMQTANGQTLSGAPSLSSVTEKFCIKKLSNSYEIRYYTSDYSTLPNRRFSGLKIREKEYWHFKFVEQKTVSAEAFAVCLAIERAGREAIEYDFVVSKYTRNQIIIKKGKAFEQLVLDGEWLLHNTFAFKN